MSDDNARIGSPAGRSTDEPHIGKYRLIKTIGKGNFAKVKLAKHLPTGRQVIFRSMFYYVFLLKFMFLLLLGSGKRKAGMVQLHTFADKHVGMQVKL